MHMILRLKELNGVIESWCHFTHSKTFFYQQKPKNNAPDLLEITTDPSILKLLVSVSGHRWAGLEWIATFNFL